MSDTTGLDRRRFLGMMTLTAAAVAAPGFVRAAAPAKRLAGVFPIAFTPIGENDQVDYEGLAAQMTFCRKGGVHGIAWPQLASGWTTLSEDERMRGAEVLAKAAQGGRTALVLGVQAKSGLQETERYARQAQQLGADALILIPPAGVTDPAALLDHYQQVGSMTSLPLFAQAVGEFSVDLLVQMYEKIPTLRYVKDEAGEPLDRIAEIRRRTNDGMKVFSGRGVATMITEMERGFSGHCPYVSIADLYAAAYDAFHAGNRRKAFDIFGKIQACNTMFPQSDVNVLIARGVFRPGTTTRAAPPVPGAAPPRRGNSVHMTIEEIRNALGTYLKGDLRA